MNDRQAQRNREMPLPAGGSAPAGTDTPDPMESEEAGGDRSTAFLRPAAKLMNQTREGVAWLNTAGEVLYANEAMQRLLGRPERELLGVNLQDAVLGLTPTLWQRWRDRLESTGLLQFETHLPGIWGGRPVEVTAHWFDEEGEQYVGLLLRDLSDRYRVRQAALEGEHRLQLVLQATSDGVWDVDLVTGQTYRSPQIMRQLGFELDDFGDAHEALKNLSHPADHEATLQAVQDHIDGKTPKIEVAYRAQHRLGHWVWILSRGKVVARDAEGKPTRIVGTHQDITEYKRAQEALERQQRLLMNISDSMPAGLLIIDARCGQITFSNAEARSLLGRRQLNEVPVRSVLRRFSADDRRELIGAFRAILEPWSDQTLQGEVMLDSGERARSLQFQLRGFEHDQQGRLLNAIVVALDQTEHKRAENQRRQMEQRLSQIARLESIGTLAGGVAHDFGNLLMAIEVAAHLSREKLEVGHPVHGQLETIGMACEQGREVTQSLLTFSQGSQSDKRPMELTRVIGGSLRLIRRLMPATIQVHAPLWLDTAATMMSPGPGSGGPTERFLMSGNPGQLQQAILNLAINARDAMPAGGKLSFTLQRIHERWVELVVIDTGMGMAESVGQRIFEPFFTTKPRGQGTGLGLSVALGIVKDHGGSIEVESSPGRGACFTVRLPVLAAEPADGQVVCLPEGRQSELPRFTGDVLLVEDQPVVRQLLQEALFELGFEVFAVSTGRDAMEVFRRRLDSLKLVLLDLDLPDGRGESLIAPLAGRSERLPVVVLSGSRGEAEELKRLGASAMIGKPCSMERLIAVIEQVLGVGETDSGS